VANASIQREAAAKTCGRAFFRISKPNATCRRALIRPDAVLAQAVYGPTGLPLLHAGVKLT